MRPARTVPGVTGDDEVPLDEVAAGLRAILAGIVGAPDTSADPLHVAYLHGAADALAMAAGTSEGDCPDPNESGHDVRDE